MAESLPLWSGHSCPLVFVVLQASGQESLRLSLRAGPLHTDDLNPKEQKQFSPSLQRWGVSPKERTSPGGTAQSTELYPAFSVVCMFSAAASGPLGLAPAPSGAELLSATALAAGINSA